LSDRNKTTFVGVKKLTFILLLIGALFAGCSNDLNVTAPWKDIPIVYGILSPLDTAHYIRIEKAFLDPETSALEIARIPDSLYYKNLDVSIFDISSGVRIQMVEVDGIQDGYVRDEGVFAEVPNILYKADAKDLDLTAANAYRLEINRSERLPLVTSEIEIVSRVAMVRPLPDAELRFPYESLFKVIWRKVDNAFFYDVSLIIHYNEWTMGDPGSIEKRDIQWNLARNISADRVEVLGISFYEFLGAELEVEPTLLRSLIDVDVIIRSGGRELFEFRRVLQANSGITSVGGDIPQYTNMSEGFGIMTSSNSTKNLELKLHSVSLDSLREGYLTKDLNFQ
jgi:hypothetical protein